MPPRYAYWTIIVDNQPTAFRSGSQEELMPTFKRLKAKNDTAVMMWFQNGKLWPSRVDAQEMMHARGEMGRKGDERQLARRPFSGGAAASGSGFRDRDRKPARERSERSAWTPRGEPSTPPPARNADDKLDWKPKGEFVPAPKRSERPERPDWKSKPSSPSTYAKAPADRQAFKPARSEKPEWKPKGSFTPAPRRSEGPDWRSKPSSPSYAKPSDKQAFKPSRPEERPRSFKRPDFKPSGDDTRSAKPEWKPKGSFDRERKPDWKSKPSSPSTYAKAPADRQALKPSRSEKPDWKPKGETSSPSTYAKAPADRQAFKPSSPEKRKWVPKEEYKKSMGIEARRDSKWRPGGEHKDPKQKYKDAKKAKWSKFKQNIRARSGGKGKKQS